MKFGRTLIYHKIKDEFEFEKNHIDRMQTASKRHLKNTISQKCQIDINQNWAGCYDIEK